MPFDRPFWSPSQADAVLFDWDGVLAETHLDFSALRQKYFGGRRAMLLEDSILLPAGERVSFMRELAELEVAGAESAVPVAGARRLLTFIEEQGIPWGVVSRNCRASLDVAAHRVGIELPQVVRTRDDGPYVKPDPRALTDAALSLSASPSDTLFIGDFIYDMIGARRAGMRGALVNRKPEAAWQPWIELCLPDMTTFTRLFERPGKLIPWEYRAAIKEIGRHRFCANFALTVAVEEKHVPRLGFLLARAAALGVGTFSVQEMTITPLLWRDAPELDPAWMGHSLRHATSEFLRSRFPFARVCGECDGAAALEDDFR